MTQETAAQDAANWNDADTARFWTLFECTLHPMLFADDDRRYRAVNTAACLLLRMGPGEVKGRTVDDFTPPEAPAGLAEPWDSFLAGGSLAGTYVLQMPDGSRLPVEYSAVPQFLRGWHLFVLIPDYLADGRSHVESLQQAIPGAAGKHRPASPLSQRETEILTLVALGASGADIARRLFLSPQTVRTHIRNSLCKLGAKTRAHAIAIALQQGVIEVDWTNPAGYPSE